MALTLAPFSIPPSTFDDVSARHGMSVSPVRELSAAGQSSPGRWAAVPPRPPGPHPVSTTTESPSAAPPPQRTRAGPVRPQRRSTIGRPRPSSRGQGGAGRSTPAPSHDTARPARVHTASIIAARDKIMVSVAKKVLDYAGGSEERKGWGGCGGGAVAAMSL